MNRCSRFPIWPTVVVLAFMSWAGFAVADQLPSDNASGRTTAVPGPKRVIEFPTKQIIRDQSAPASPAPADFVNPKVEPGKVRWHASFAAACDAARKSSKPVLLFHLMGKLDDQFC